MQNNTLQLSELVNKHNNIPVTTSLKIAEVFGKRHDHVLRDIENLKIPIEFSLPNFGETSYLDSQGKKQKAYEITKNGFILLAMGFTGEKAMSFKIAYINAFDLMDKALMQQNSNSETLYFEQKRQLITEKHQLDTQIKQINVLLNNSLDGQKLISVQKKLSEVKAKIEKLEKKQFGHVYTLFSLIEN